MIAGPTGRRLRRLGHLAPLILGLAAGGTAGFGAEAAAPVPLVFQLDLGVKNAQFAGLLWADHHGWYREAGLEVRIVAATSDLNVARRVAEGPATIGSIESGLFISGRAAGLPLVAIGTMFQASPLCLISFTDLGIKTPADLVGKRVAIHGDGHEALATVLERAGIRSHQLTISEAQYGNGPLLRREVDAKQGYLIDEFVALQTAGHPVSALSLRDFGNQAYSQVYFVSESLLRSQRASLVRFLEVSNRGWRAALADVPAAARLVVNRYAPGLDLAYQEASLRSLAPLITAESPRVGTMQLATWRANLESYQRSHADKPVDAMERWLDFTLTEEANRIAESAGGSATNAAIVPVYGKMNEKRTLMNDEELAAAVAQLPGWKIEAGKLRKTFVRKNFPAAVAFIQSLVPVCEEMDHHPEIFTVYNKVNLALVSFDAGNRVTATDIELARRIETLSTP